MCKQGSYTPPISQDGGMCACQSMMPQPPACVPLLMRPHLNAVDLSAKPILRACLGMTALASRAVIAHPTCCNLLPSTCGTHHRQVTLEGA